MESINLLPKYLKYRSQSAKSDGSRSRHALNESFPFKTHLDMHAAKLSDQ
jgi:hypothetical protein